MKQGMGLFADQISSCEDFLLHSCSFTGHRPGKLPWRYDETAPECVALKAALAERIAALADAGIVHYLSGMAEGVDCYAASIVLALRERNPAIKLHCILPCVGQDSRWSEESRKRYRSILEQADAVRFVNRKRVKDCMLKRDELLCGERLFSEHLGRT